MACREMIKDNATILMSLAYRGTMFKPALRSLGEALLLSRRTLLIVLSIILPTDVQLRCVSVACLRTFSLCQ